MFKIETIVNRVVKGSDLVSVESFVIVDEANKLVAGTKAYDTREEAQAKIDSMGNFEYLDWIAAGKPVKEAKTEEAEAVEDVAAPEVPVSEEEEF